MRLATETVFCAYLASCVESTWMINDLTTFVSDFVDAKSMISSFENQIFVAYQALEEKISTPGALQVQELLHHASQVHSTQASALRAVRARRETCLSGDNLVLPAGIEDAEFDADHFQASLCAIVDDERALIVLECLNEPDTQNRHRRLLDIRDSIVCSECM